MNKLKTTFFIILLLPSLLQAQVKLSLLEAVQMAKDKSLQASINLNLFYAAQVNYKSASANRLPLINGFVNAPGLDRSYGQVIQQDGTIQFKEKTQAISSGSINLQQNLMATGGVISISA
jgi:hypothetical protein